MVTDKSNTLTSFAFPSEEVRTSFGANADFGIDWIEIRRNKCYVRGIRIGYSNGLVSPYMGGKDAEKSQVSRLDDLGRSRITKVRLKVIDNVSRPPSYAGIEVTNETVQGSGRVIVGGIAAEAGEQETYVRRQPERSKFVNLNVKMKECLKS